MKKIYIFTILFVLMVSPLGASDVLVLFAVDKSAAEPDLAGIRVYIDDHSHGGLPWDESLIPDNGDFNFAEQGYTFTPGEDLEITLLPVNFDGPDGSTEIFYAVATAYDEDLNESGYSDELEFSIDFPDETPPGCPINLRMSTQ